MAELETQDSQKTIVAFVVGLLIGGMLVWAFSGPEDAAQSDNLDSDAEQIQTTDDVDTDGTNNETSNTLKVGEGDITITDQPAGSSVAIDDATYPVAEGWVGVREYDNDQLGYILGVSRFSESQGLVPEQIELVRATTPGKKYAVVIYREDGDFDFNLATDVQIDTIFTTFTAE